LPKWINYPEDVEMTGRAASLGVMAMQLIECPHCHESLEFDSANATWITRCRRESQPTPPEILAAIRCPRCSKVFDYEISELLREAPNRPGN
jgi:DNA-directed RNA polymerase subunit RPC12/RpoP